MNNRCVRFVSKTGTSCEMRKDFEERSARNWLDMVQNVQRFENNSISIRINISIVSDPPIRLAWVIYCSMQLNSDLFRLLYVQFKFPASFARDFTLYFLTCQFLREKFSVNLIVNLVHLTYAKWFIKHLITSFYGRINYVWREFLGTKI